MGNTEQYPLEAEEQLINEEYKIWKKNTPFLYGNQQQFSARDACI